MADATFDGENLLIQLPAGQTEVDVERELYSAWKEWLKTSDNAKYQLAMRTVAGDDSLPGQTLAPGFFVRNDLGWRLQPPDEDIEISLVGNIYSQDTTLPLVVTRPGRTILLTGDRSSNALVVAGGSGSGDWTDLEKRQIRYQVGVDGDKTMPISVPGIADALLDLVDGIEDGVTLRQAIRAMAATLAGDDPSGGGASTFRAIGNPGTIRVQSAADETGKRTVSLNL